MYCNDDSAVAVCIQKPEAGKSRGHCDAVVLCGIFCVFDALKMREEILELTSMGDSPKEEG